MESMVGWQEEEGAGEGGAGAEKKEGGGGGDGGSGLPLVPLSSSPPLPPSFLFAPSDEDKRLEDCKSLVHALEEEARDLAAQHVEIVAVKEKLQTRYMVLRRQHQNATCAQSKVQSLMQRGPLRGGCDKAQALDLYFAGRTNRKRNYRRNRNRIPVVLQHACAAKTNASVPCVAAATVASASASHEGVHDEGVGPQRSVETPIGDRSIGGRSGASRSVEKVPVGQRPSPVKYPGVQVASKAR
jgi:hypothetical protein